MKISMSFEFNGIEIRRGAFFDLLKRVKHKTTSLYPKLDVGDRVFGIEKAEEKIIALLVSARMNLLIRDRNLRHVSEFLKSQIVGCVRLSPDEIRCKYSRQELVSYFEKSAWRDGDAGMVGGGKIPENKRVIMWGHIRTCCLFLNIPSPFPLPPGSIMEIDNFSDAANLIFERLDDLTISV